MAMPPVALALLLTCAIVAATVALVPNAHAAGVAALAYVLLVAVVRVNTLETTLWDAETAAYVGAAVGAATVPALAEPLARAMAIPPPDPSATSLAAAVGAALVVYSAHRALVRGGAGFDRDVVMAGRVCVVTGANSGIGLETAASLAQLGATVVLGCRDEAKMAAAAAEIRRRHPQAVLHCSPLDLCSLDSVHGFVEAIHRAGLKPAVLVNNAGVLMTARRLTSSGVETSVAANHLGPFLLTRLLLPTLLRQPDPRVVTVGSALHRLPDRLDLREMKTREGFQTSDIFSVYADTKLCNMVFTKELHRRYGDKGLVATCVHPGTVLTDITRDMHWAVQLLHRAFSPALLLFGTKTAAAGCESSVHAATSPLLRGRGGTYLLNCRAAPCNPVADDEALGSKLWEWSVTLTEMR